MDFKDLIRFGFDEYLRDLKTVLEGLSAEERRFQPALGSHHIDFAVWHMARVEDGWLQGFARRTDSIWQRDGWHQRLGMPERGSGFGYTGEQVRDLPAFDIDQMLEYYDAVRADTYAYVDSLTEAGLAETPNDRRPEYTIAQMFSHLMIEEGQHLGQVAYIRGIQRGLGG
jgi:uncharacterized damage-inducible protein DinB